MVRLVDVSGFPHHSAQLPQQHDYSGQAETRARASSFLIKRSHSSSNMASRSRSVTADIRCGVMVRNPPDEGLPHHWSRSSNPCIGAAGRGDDYGSPMRKSLVGFIMAEVWWPQAEICSHGSRHVFSIHSLLEVSPSNFSDTPSS